METEESTQTLVEANHISFVQPEHKVNKAERIVIKRNLYLFDLIVI